MSSICRFISLLFVQHCSSKSSCTIVIASIFIAYEGFRSSHREATHDHDEFMTNAGNRAGRPMCTAGTSKSNRTDQQAKTRAIEHAPIDLTSRRPTPDAIHVTGGSLPGHPPPLPFLPPPVTLFHHRLVVSSRRKTRARRLPRFPRIDLRQIESLHTAESRTTHRERSREFRESVDADRLPLSAISPSFLLQIHYAEMDGKVKNRRDGEIC